MGDEVQFHEDLTIVDLDGEAGGCELQPVLHQHLKKHLDDGTVWRLQVDTFEPELERYGGAAGFSLVEKWFSLDSQQILELLASGTPLEERWKLGLIRVDLIWAALGLGIQERKFLAQVTRDGFRKEFHDSGEMTIGIGARFRELRKEIGSRFIPSTVDFHSDCHGALSPLKEALGQGLIQEDVANIAGSLAHMHLNRLLRTSQRESEWVIMEFLTRLYESWLARFPGD